MNKIIVFLIFLATSFIEVNAIDVITALKIYRDSPFNLSSDEKVKYEKLAIEGDGDAAYKLGRYYLYCENTEYNEKIYISARSIDEVNVQLVMEKLGGGGHMSIAGAQLTGCTVKEAVDTIKETLDNMLAEGEI